MESSIQKQIAEALNSYGKSPAIIEATGKVTTYRSLKEQANFICSCFNNYPVDSFPLPILSEKNSSVVVSFLSCLISKICYVPLDFDAPVSRNLDILNRISSPYLLLSSKAISQYESIIDSVLKEVQPGLFLTKTSFKGRSFNINSCYILFTSGSTGTPRGVNITYKNAEAFINWAKGVFSSYIGSVLSVAPFHFDLSVFDIYCTITSGGTLLIPDPQLIKRPKNLSSYILHNNVNVIYTTPSAYMFLIEHGQLSTQQFTDVKLLLCAGEPMTSKLFEMLQHTFPNADIFNLYGPTETNVCAFYKADRAVKYHQNVPIGKVCSHLSAVLFNEGIIEGNEGELCIAGDNVFEGYWNEATPEKFFVYDKNRYYKTGDWVKQTDLGFIYVGRKDRMIKVNGYRTELAEVEKTLIGFDGIVWCAVMPNETRNRMELVGFVVNSNSSATLDVLAIKTFMASKLPAHMIPSRIYSLKEVPLNSNQKVDYAFLKTLL